MKFLIEKGKDYSEFRGNEALKVKHNNLFVRFYKRDLGDKQIYFTHYITTDNNKTNYNSNNNNLILNFNIMINI